MVDNRLDEVLKIRQQIFIVVHHAAFEELLSHLNSDQIYGQIALLKSLDQQLMTSVEELLHLKSCGVGLYLTPQLLERLFTLAPVVVKGVFTFFLLVVICHLSDSHRTGTLNLDILEQPDEMVLDILRKF